MVCAGEEDNFLLHGESLPANKPPQRGTKLGLHVGSSGLDAPALQPQNKAPSCSSFQNLSLQKNWVSQAYCSAQTSIHVSMDIKCASQHGKQDESHNPFSS